MSAFVDSTLLNFSQDSFVAGLLNGIGLQTIFDATFDAADFSVQSVALGPLTPRAYKVPAFESIRISGVDERVLPDAQRTNSERVLARYGRLDWVDVAFDAVLQTKVQTLTTPLQSVTLQTLEEKLGGVASIDELRAKLLNLFAPSLVDALFADLRISTLDDFRRQEHLFVELVGAAPPAFDPNDPATAKSYAVSLGVKIVDGFDLGAALQSAKLCRSILETSAIADVRPGFERTNAVVFLTLFADGAVTDTSLPGFTAAEAKTAVSALFSAESMFAHFI